MNEILETVRHSAAHIMAEAVKSIFPDAKFGIGPAIKDGFYYDFDLPRPLTPDDLPLIDEKMREIVAADTPFTREEVSSAHVLRGRQDGDLLLRGPRMVLDACPKKAPGRMPLLNLLPWMASSPGIRRHRLARKRMQ